LSNTAKETIEPTETSAWDTNSWEEVERRVLRYQTRIYKATKDKKKEKVRRIQKRLLKSFDAKLLAVRRVTTDNRGKNTPGVDEKVYTSSIEKEKLVCNLRLDGYAHPIKHVYIPKPGKAEKPPLGIATIKDRAKQALCKLIIEPEWEAQFEENSYGFRPGRSCHDAMEAIQNNLRNATGQKNHHKYVLDADINKCFDQINHEYLIEKLDTLPEIKTQVNAWLKAGIMEELQTCKNLDMVLPNPIGTPQGGVISPLLSNIALHGMENHMKEWICTEPSFNKANKKKAKRQSLAVIRYADNFVLIHKNRGIIEEAKDEIAQWLKNGPQLELSETKTSIKNSNEGFNFLGFSCITIRRGNKNRLKIYPSRDSQKRLNLKTRTIIQKNKSASSYVLILLLRPVIIGWANYFRYSECSQVFKNQSKIIFQQLRAWCFRRDTKNSRATIKEKYFPSGNTYYFEGTYHENNWILTGKNRDKNDILHEAYLPNLEWVKSKKWTKIKGDASPYDGNNIYWRQRTKVKELSNTTNKMNRIQKGYAHGARHPFIRFNSRSDYIFLKPQVGKTLL
jgi:RNA-directed DNA polymerase